MQSGLSAKKLLEIAKTAYEAGNREKAKKIIFSMLRKRCKVVCLPRSYWKSPRQPTRQATGRKQKRLFSRCCESDAKWFVCQEATGNRQDSLRGRQQGESKKDYFLDAAKAMQSGLSAKKLLEIAKTAYEAGNR